MSRKKKKSKDEWVNFIRQLFNRKRKEVPHTLPKEYLLSVADKIWRNTPTKEIIYNTLVEVASVCYEKGYTRKSYEVSSFKEQQEKHFSEDFNKLKDEIDDMIHVKSNQQK